MPDPKVIISNLKYMGNICCPDEQPQKKRLSIRPVNNKQTPMPQVNRISSAIRFENQK